MKEIYILRHGIAVERGASSFMSDASRPLTGEGIEKMGKAALGMKALGVNPDWILSSPLIRTKQTAEIVGSALGLSKKVRLCDELAPGMDFKKLIEILRNDYPNSEAVMLIGHEPDLSALISFLVSGKAAVWIHFRKGALCRLDLEEGLQYGACASLEWLLTAKHLGMMIQA